jgi:uncharacterized protein (DUF58 family)
LKRMLRNWIAYYLLLMASLAFALLYPGRASSALFYALLFLPPASLITLAVLLKEFRYEQSVGSLAAIKGETVSYKLKVKNRGILFLPCIEIAFLAGGTIYEYDFAARKLALPPRSETTLDISLICKYKGICEIGVRQIRLRDFLGLFSFRQEVGSLGTLAISPRIIPIIGFPVVAGGESEESTAGARRGENAETVSDIRNYISGDRLRSIHWKLSAKREELMVKNFERTSGASVELMLDTSFSVRGREEGLALEDKLVECAVALAHHLAVRTIPFTLWYCVDSIVRLRQNSIRDFNMAYRMLSETAFCGSAPLQDIAALAMSDGVRKKTVVIVSAGILPSLYVETLKLKDCGCIVAVICVDDGSAGAQVPGETRESLRRAGVLLYRVGIGESIDAALMQRAT